MSSLWPGWIKQTPPYGTLPCHCNIRIREIRTASVAGDNQSPGRDFNFAMTFVLQSKLCWLETLLSRCKSSFSRISLRLKIFCINYVYHVRVVHYSSICMNKLNTDSKLFPGIKPKNIPLQEGTQKVSLRFENLLSNVLGMYKSHLCFVAWWYISLQGVNSIGLFLAFPEDLCWNAECGTPFVIRH